MDATATATVIPEVREGKQEDLSRLAAMLARSFESCPAWKWYLPPESRGRLQRMEHFFGLLLDRFYLETDDGRECFTTRDLEGAALWDPPGGWKMSPGDNLRMLSTMAPVFRRGLPRTVRGFSALESGHPEEPHYYLSVLGAEPRRGGAIAEAVMQPGIDRCDREGLPAYVETGRSGSRDFFGKHGFEVTEELNLPGSGPPVWRMWREPR